jgi:hypothetical protein
LEPVPAGAKNFSTSRVFDVLLLCSAFSCV